MKWTFVLLFSFLLLFSAPIWAQEDERELKLHVEVRVELNNESELEGIVVDGRFYEKYDDKKNRWKTMPSRKGSGLRLWHVEKAEGYIFLNYETDIRRIEEIGKKSQKELEELRAEIIRIKQLERERSERDRANQEASKNGEEKTTEEETGKKTENSEELDAETLRKYEQLLERFPPSDFNISKIAQAIKIRMASGVPLSRDHKDYLSEYTTWRKAVQHKNNIPPIKDFTEEQLLQAQELLAKFPPENYKIAEKVQSFSTKAFQEIPLAPVDAEWLESLDKWLDAQEILTLSKSKESEKKAESEVKKETESNE